MTGLILDLYLLLAAVALLFIGGLITWPVARRVGERRPDPYLWVPVETATGREWHHAPPPRPTRRERAAAWWVTRVRERAAAWWAATAPRNPHVAVHRAMAGRANRTPPWSGYGGGHRAGMA